MTIDLLFSIYLSTILFIGQTTCRICSKKMKNTVLLRQHLRRQHEIMDKNLVRKMTSTFTPGAIACNVCGKQVKNNEMLKKHYRRIHSIFDPQMMVEMMSGDVDIDNVGLDIPEQSPESPIVEVPGPGNITPPERKQPAFPQHVEHNSNYGGHWTPQGQFGYMGHNFGTWGSNWGYPYNMGHVHYGYQPPVTPLYQPGPFKQEPNNSEPLNLDNRANENITENLYSSKIEDVKASSMDTHSSNNNSQLPEENNQTEVTDKKEDEIENTIKEEVVSEEEDESDESDFEEASSDIDQNRDDDYEISEDEGSNNCPTIPVDTIIKCEKGSDDEGDDNNDEDYSPNNTSLTVPPDARIKCPLDCKSTFKDRTGVLQHLRRFHKTEKLDAQKLILTYVYPEIKSDIKVSCPQCQKIFLNQRRLDIHVANYHVIGDYTCDKCGETFHLKGKLKDHVFSKHTQPFTRTTTVCHICTKDVRNINAHIRDMHTNANLICHLCTKTFQNQKYLSSHISSAHTDPSKQRMCPHCSKMCKNTIYLRQHINKVHSTDEDKIDCPKCTKTFKNRKYLGAHLSTAHTDPGQAKVCPVCSKVLKNGVYYRQHINKMHGGQETPVSEPHVNPVNLLNKMHGGQETSVSVPRVNPINLLNKMHGGQETSMSIPHVNPVNLLSKMHGGQETSMSVPHVNPVNLLSKMHGVQETPMSIRHVNPVNLSHGSIHGYH